MWWNSQCTWQTWILYSCCSFFYFLSVANLHSNHDACIKIYEYHKQFLSVHWETPLKKYSYSVLMCRPMPMNKIFYDYHIFLFQIIVQLQFRCYKDITKHYIQRNIHHHSGNFFSAIHLPVYVLSFNLHNYWVNST